MKTMKKTLLAMSVTLLVSTHALAGTNGVEVTDDTFNDYLVFATTNTLNNAGCGAQLVAGKYVITAAHCIISAWGNNQSEKWMTIPADGVLTEALITETQPRVYFGKKEKTQGVEFYAKSVYIHPEYVFGFQHPTTQVSAYEEAEATAFMAATGVTDGDLMGSRPSVWGDIMVYELADTVAQQSAALIAVSNKQIANQATLNWTGWGITEAGTTPLVAHTGSISYTAYPYSDWQSLYWFYNIDIETATTKDGSNICSGDSGSPVLVDGKVLGYVSSSTMGCGDADSRTSLTAGWFHLPWLASKINAINTVGKATLEAPAAGEHTVTWTIPVQSLKVADVTFAPEIIDSTGLFTSDDLANCEGTFATGESCELHVTFNAAGSTVSSAKSATLKLNDETSIPLSFAIVTDNGGGENGGSDNGGGSSGGSSGGGSMNWLVLAGLGLATLVRKFRK